MKKLAILSILLATTACSETSAPSEERIADNAATPDDLAVEADVASETEVAEVTDQAPSEPVASSTPVEPKPSASPPPPPPPPPAPSKAREPAFKRGWQTDNLVAVTYPARAVKEGRQGTVVMKMTVTPSGRALNCRVTGSSGHPDLDRAACTGMEAKGRFDPALNDAGNPISADFATSLEYSLNQ